jgi:spore maturation protein CgeB
MNILIYRYGSICEPDIIETFHKLGFQVDEETSLIKNKILSDNDCIQIVSERILQNQYAFVFTINFFPWLSHLCNLTHLPYLSLIVDSPVLELYDNAIKNPCNRIFMFDKASYLDFYDKNPNCIFYLPLATNVTRTNKLFNTTASELKKKYEADISFIGSTYQEKCAFNQIKLPEYESGYAMGIIEAQLKVYGYNFIEEMLSDDFVQKFMKYAQNIDVAANEIPIYRAIVAQHFLSVKVGEQERLRLLKLISEHFDVNMYTGSNTSSMPLIHNCGYASSLVDMPLIFHKSKINLNITAKSIRSGLSLRIFDVLGCGGFLITNFQSELPDYFEIGKDLVTYESPQDLLDKCSYYLKHEDERIEIANNGYEKVKQFHTWDIRLVQLLQLAFPDIMN